MTTESAGARLLALLERAALDGHTVVPVAVAGSVLGSLGLRLENALREVGPAGSGIVAAPDANLLGLRRLVDAERAVATAVVALSAQHRLGVVAGPAGKARDAIAAGAGGDKAAIADDAQYLDIETIATFFRSCADDEVAVLAGDLEGLGSPGAGNAFADIAASGLVDVVAAAGDPDARGSVIEEFLAGLRGGTLGPLDDPSREVVLVGARSAAEAAHRVVQLVTDSIPRALAIGSHDVQVLTPVRGGPCGAVALAERLAVHGAQAPPPMTVHEGLGRRRPAVVFVVPPEAAGLLCRQLVYSAAAVATRHLSVVNAAGQALAVAVTDRPRKPRRTLLPGLLQERIATPDAESYSSSDSHSRSSSSTSSSSPASTGPNGVTSSYAENSASS